MLKSFSTKVLGVRKGVCYDICVVGGGIIGLAAARELLLRHNGLRLAILEKEASLGMHQTGHNSGVVHAGIYYRPGSLKALLCVRGMQRCYEYFNLKNIPYRKCGKLIVATDQQEVARLRKLFENAKLNQVPDVQYLSTSEAIKQLEPKVTGMAAIYSPHTGIVDYRKVARSLAEDIAAKGGDICLFHEVVNYMKSGEQISIRIASQPTIYTRSIINCGGLQSDSLANIDTRSSSEARIIPVVGQYLQLPLTTPPLTTHCIYPVPTPNLPFLGVHLTPTLDNKLLLGPNVIPSITTKPMSTLLYKGTYHLLRTHYTTLISELLRATFPRFQIAQARRYLPELPSTYTRGLSGIRAQLVAKDGTLIDDFLFEQVQNDALHARNVPSPGATGSLAIAELIADKAKSLRGLQ